VYVHSDSRGLYVFEAKQDIRSWRGAVEFEESLAQVQRLLCMLPGVEVASVRCGPRFTDIALAIQSQDSLGRLAHIIGAANVMLSVEPASQSRTYGSPGCPEDLRYALRVPQNPKRWTPPTTLQTVGIFLARELKALKLLSADESDRLQVAWNAAIM
jgi:hypothetical protein